MIFNGAVPTSQQVIYTVPPPTGGLTKSGNNQEFNFFRVVNNAAVMRTLNIYLNVNGVARLITPKALQLPPGAAWDDVPIFQMAMTNTIEMLTDGDDVTWTLNVYTLPA